MATNACARCGSDGKGVGGLRGIGGCILCAICAEEYRGSEHAPERGGRGVPAWLRAELGPTKEEIEAEATS